MWSVNLPAGVSVGMRAAVGHPAGQIPQPVPANMIVGRGGGGLRG
jgi:hypothetical protein